MKYESKYDSLVGKKVVLQREIDGTVEDQPGLAEAVNALGVLFKPKGRSAPTLVLWHEVVGLEGDDSGPVTGKITQKRLNPVEDGHVKQHLADRHGIPLSQINGLDEAGAVQLHNQLHQSDTAKEISHRHGPKGTRVGSTEVAA